MVDFKMILHSKSLRDAHIFLRFQFPLLTRVDYKRVPNPVGMVLMVEKNWVMVFKIP
jgi:hypothetical protein